MNRNHLYGALAVAVLLVCSTCAYSQTTATNKVSVSFIHNGFLYAAERNMGKSGFILQSQLFPQMAKGKGGGLEKPIEQAIEWRTVEPLLEKGSEYQWRLANGYFWGTMAAAEFKQTSITRIAVEELTLFKTGNPALWAPPIEFQKKHPKDTNWYLDPVYETVCKDYEDKHPKRDPGATRVRYVDDRDHQIQGIYFDFFPITQTKMTVFVLWKDKIHVWPCSAVKSKGGYTEFDLECVEDKDEIIAVDFKERFRVFGKDRTYYFVTQSGNLYCSPKPAGKEKRKAAALWKDEKSPIRAVICDTASDSTFVFTEPAKKGGERIYIELAETIDTKPYERVPVEGVKEPLKTVMEYAQVLVKDKRIK